MKLFHAGPDGGPQSPVTGYWLVEIKSLFSVALLRFEQGSREAYHEHAFNSISWLLKGFLRERFAGPDTRLRYHRPSLWPIITRRSDLHKVDARSTSWVLTFRGPWTKTWREYLPGERTFVTLTHGRRIITRRRRQGQAL